MDNKGRVSIPARYREILEEQQDRQIILTNCGRLGPGLPSIRVDYLRRPELVRDSRCLTHGTSGPLQRFLISGAEECALDRQGRILVPPNLRDYARLGREVVPGGGPPLF